MKQFNPVKNKITLFLLIAFGFQLSAQQDSVKRKWFSAHFQFTSIGQYHAPFPAAYTGANSMATTEDPAISLTATMYLGARLWKGAAIYVNPEIAGGAGLSKTLGVAGFPNGETFRVGSVEPKVYIARAYLRQYIAISKKKTFQEDDANQVAGYVPESYVSITAGRFSVADFFDLNTYSHDPRTQFFNWALMSNAAWDYPANTRGYTYGLILELVKPIWGIRYGFTLVPKEANASNMNLDLREAGAHMLEGEIGWKLKGKSGKIRALVFMNMANMGNYDLASQMDTPDITATRKFSRLKYGFGINAEQSLNDFMGFFLKGSWNDGINETWMFTEIDHSVSAGLSFDGKKWKRSNDVLGVALVMDGISKQHRQSLQKGGAGFMLGDGNLNYAPEFIAELYYSFDLWKNRIFITPDYQFVLNPGYNSDRGPINLFGLRAHVEF